MLLMSTNPIRICIYQEHYRYQLPGRVIRSQLVTMSLLGNRGQWHVYGGVTEVNKPEPDSAVIGTQDTAGGIWSGAIKESF